MTQYASLIFYEEEIVKQTNLNSLNFEIKKEMVYKKEYKANVLVIYITLLTREEADQKLKSFKIENGINRRYMPFRETDQTIESDIYT